MLADQPRRELLARQAALQRRVDRDVHDPHRQRDRVRRRPPQRALAVPAVEQVRQARGNRSQGAGLLGEHPRHLAVGCHRRARQPDHPRQPLGDLYHAGRRRDARVGKSPDQVGHHLTAGPVQQRIQVFGQGTTEHLRGQMRIRRAARVRQQAPVIRLHRGLTVHTKPIRQPHRDHRRLQAVLEREPHAQIGGQAQGADDLSGAQLLGRGPSTMRTHPAQTTEDPPKLNDKERAAPCIVEGASAGVV
ncbi:MAG: hypothetical protein ACM3ML_19700 [Micromonosporaceae bacterium]